MEALQNASRPKNEHSFIRWLPYPKTESPTESMPWFDFGSGVVISQNFWFCKANILSF